MSGALLPLPPTPVRPGRGRTRAQGRAALGQRPVDESRQFASRRRLAHRYKRARAGAAGGPHLATLLMRHPNGGAGGVVQPRPAAAAAGAAAAREDGRQRTMLGAAALRRPLLRRRVVAPEAEAAPARSAGHREQTRP
eukprot:scaffold1970_cov396-Prasinococcus_capsulatus_cf.AAC.22